MSEPRCRHCGRAIACRPDVMSVFHKDFFHVGEDGHFHTHCANKDGSADLDTVAEPMEEP